MIETEDWFRQSCLVAERLRRIVEPPSRWADGTYKARPCDCEKWTRTFCRRCGCALCLDCRYQDIADWLCADCYQEEAAA